MKNEQRKVPQIRFPGFTEEWELRKLSILTSLITKGTTPLDKSGVGEINFIKVENLDSSNGEIISCSKITKEEHEGYLKRSQLKENDILFSIAGTLGRVGIVKLSVLPANTNQALSIIRLKDGYLKYIATVLRGNAVERFIRRNPTIGAQPNLSLEQVGNLEIPYPQIEEQIIIGDFFDNLDTLITLQQRKLDQIKEYKKGMLQKMFPKDGESVPEVRFPGFTGKWKKSKVKDLLKLLTDYDANGSFADMAKNVKTFDGTGFAWYVRMTDLENPKPLNELKYVDNDSYVFLRKTHLHGGELLMAKRGEIGKVYIFEPRTEFATVAPNMYLLKLNEKVIPKFLYYYFVSEKGNSQLVRLNASTTMGALYKDDVKNINVIMPSLPEQEKIGNFLTHIDALITLHQRKLEAMKEYKKGLLQKMFV